MSSANYHKGGLFGIGTTDIKNTNAVDEYIKAIPTLTTAATDVKTAIETFLKNKDAKKDDVTSKINTLKTVKSSVDVLYNKVVERSVFKRSLFGGRRTKRRGSSKSKTSKRR